MGKVFEAWYKTHMYGVSSLGESLERSIKAAVHSGFQAALIWIKKEVISSDELSRSIEVIIDEELEKP